MTRAFTGVLNVTQTSAAATHGRTWLLDAGCYGISVISLIQRAAVRSSDQQVVLCVTEPTDCVGALGGVQ